MSEAYAIIQKALRQTAVSMADGRVSTLYCSFCYGREATIRGIHDPMWGKCDCFCHEARKWLARGGDAPAQVVAAAMEPPVEPAPEQSTEEASLVRADDRPSGVGRKSRQPR